MGEEKYIFVFLLEEWDLVILLNNKLGVAYLLVNERTQLCDR